MFVTGSQAASLTRRASCEPAWSGRFYQAGSLSPGQPSSLRRILPERDCLTSSLKFAALGNRYCGCIIDLCFGRLAVAMNESVTQIKDTTANPAPLGLLGFGMTTVLLNLHNAGFYELNSMILAMGICYGGAAQIVAGIMEWRKGNTFATTAFLSYGLFWFSLVALIVLPKLGWATPSNDTAMAAVPLHVGVIHGSDVRRHLAVARRRASRFRVADHSFLSARDRRFHQRRTRFQTFYWLRRNLLRVLRDLRRPRTSAQRSLRQSHPAARRSDEVIVRLPSSGSGGDVACRSRRFAADTAASTAQSGLALLKQAWTRA